MRICNLCPEKHHGRGLCLKHYSRLIYKENPGKFRLKSKNNYNKPGAKEKQSKYMREWNNKNTQKQKLYRKKYYEENPEVQFRYHVKYFKKLGKPYNMDEKQYKWALQSWSRTVRKLDNYMCKNCDSTEKIHAHHLQPKKDYPELGLDLDNGVTLCDDCHIAIHI